MVPGNGADPAAQEPALQAGPHAGPAHKLHVELLLLDVPAGPRRLPRRTRTLPPLRPEDLQCLGGRLPCLFRDLPDLERNPAQLSLWTAALASDLGTL